MRRMMLSLAVLVLAAGPAFAGDKYNKKITIGEKAPVFSGIPAVMGEEATSISLPDVKEDVVVVVFLGNHCPVVVAYEDRIIDLVNDYKGKSVKVIGVCVNNNDADRLPAIKTRVKEKGYNYVYGYDESQQVGRDYGAVVTPEFFVLDKSRNVRYAGALDDNMNEGKVTKKYVRDAIDALLAGSEPPVTTSQARGCGVQYKR